MAIFEFNVANTQLKLQDFDSDIYETYEFVKNKPLKYSNCFLCQVESCGGKLNNVRSYSNNYTGLDYSDFCCCSTKRPDKESGYWRIIKKKPPHPPLSEEQQALIDFIL